MSIDEAFAELGSAVKTIFLCRYLHSEDLRREINEGLNVIEQWNSANDFIFFARRGEMVSNRREDHEISMLALHLLQNCMVYINTLMIPDKQTLEKEVAAWQSHRNKHHAKADWQFTTENARVKLKRLYPQFNWDCIFFVR